MDLQMCLLADYAYKEPSGKLSIIGIFSNISAFQFPTRHPMMYLVIVLKPGLGEYDDTRKLRVQLLEEDGTELNQYLIDLTIPPNPIGQQPEVSVIMNFMGTEFSHPGLYEFRIYVDKEQKGSLPIQIIQAEPPGE